MPCGNRRGPMGMGPMTGRGAGFCGGSKMPGCMNPGVRAGRDAGAGPGMDAGRGGRGGRGFRHVYHATGLTGWQRAAQDEAQIAPEATASEPSQEEPLQALKAQVDAMAAALDEVRQRIDGLSARPGEGSL